MEDFVRRGRRYFWGVFFLTLTLVVAGHKFEQLSERIKDSQLGVYLKAQDGLLTSALGKLSFQAELKALKSDFQLTAHDHSQFSGIHPALSSSNQFQPLLPYGSPGSDAEIARLRWQSSNVAEPLMPAPKRHWWEIDFSTFDFAMLVRVIFAPGMIILMLLAYTVEVVFSTPFGLAQVLLIISCAPLWLAGLGFIAASMDQNESHGSRVFGALVGVVVILIASPIVALLVGWASSTFAANYSEVVVGLVFVVLALLEMILHAIGDDFLKSKFPAKTEETVPNLAAVISTTPSESSSGTADSGQAPSTSP